MWVDPIAAAMDRQRRYRKLIPMTWDEYLDEPQDVVEWTLRIEKLESDVIEQRLRNARKEKPPS